MAILEDISQVPFLTCKSSVTLDKQPVPWSSLETATPIENLQNVQQPLRAVVEQAPKTMEECEAFVESNKLVLLDDGEFVTVPVRVSSSGVEMREGDFIMMLYRAGMWDNGYRVVMDILRAKAREASASTKKRKAKKVKA